MIVEIVIILEIAHGREPAGKQIVFPQRVERDNEGGTSCVISGEIPSTLQLPLSLTALSG